MSRYIVIHGVDDLYHVAMLKNGLAVETGIFSTTDTGAMLTCEALGSHDPDGALGTLTAKEAREADLT